MPALLVVISKLTMSAKLSGTSTSEYSKDEGSSFKRLSHRLQLEIIMGRVVDSCPCRHSRKESSMPWVHQRRAGQSHISFASAHIGLDLCIPLALEAFVHQVAGFIRGLRQNSSIHISRMHRALQSGKWNCVNGQDACS